MARSASATCRITRQLKRSLSRKMLVIEDNEPSPRGASSESWQPTPLAFHMKVMI